MTTTFCARSTPTWVGRLASERGLWNSKPNKDRGEADIVAICRKTEWVAITDDRAGRGALARSGCDFAYMTSMLVAAAATGHIALGAEHAWRIHKQIQEPFDRPFLAERKQFDQCFELVARLHEQIGAPPWPGVLRDPRVDLIVEKLDGRKLSRGLRVGNG